MDGVSTVQILDSTEKLATEIQNSVDWETNSISILDKLFQIRLAKFHDDEQFQTVVDGETWVEFDNVPMGKLFHQLNL